LTRQDLIGSLKKVCVELSGQTVDAAHYIINNSDELPFLSMREIARRASIQPVSLVRLAQKLGLSGYGELRQQFIDTMPERSLRDSESVTRNERSAQALISELGTGSDLKAFVDSYFASELNIVAQAKANLTEDDLDRAAEFLARAPRVYVIGRRTAFTPAFCLAYTLQKARPFVTLLDFPGGSQDGPLGDITTGDVFVAVTFAPFNRLVHRLAKKASASGAQIIAITDSYAAPIGSVEGVLHLVAQTSGRAFPESVLGAVAIANLLAALSINRLGETARDRIRENEQYLMNSGEYLLSPVVGRAADRRSDDP
jgi:DNA-binding MurR/RpiR family transcriptional regulator